MQFATSQPRVDLPHGLGGRHPETAVVGEPSQDVGSAGVADTAEQLDGVAVALVLRAEAERRPKPIRVLEAPNEDVDEPVAEGVEQPRLDASVLPQPCPPRPARVP